MPPLLSEQMRQRIVYWRYTERKPVSEIAELAGCSDRAVYKILAWHRDYGHLSNPFAQTQGRGRVLDSGDVSYLLPLLQANPGLYLDELQLQLSEMRGVDVSIGTIYRTLSNKALSKKTVSAAAAEENKILRETWQAANGDIHEHQRQVLRELVEVQQELLGWRKPAVE